MNTMSRIFGHLERNMLSYFLGTGIVAGIMAFVDKPIQHAVLEKSNWVVKANGLGIDYYGFDDDNNGLVDRIEGIGRVSGMKWVPSSYLRETFTQEDEEFYLYSRLIMTPDYNPKLKQEE